MKLPSEVLAKLADPWWRLNNLYWIEDKYGKKIKFRANAVQQAFWEKMWYLNVVLKSRQHGMSTIINLIQLDHCLFNENQTCAIVDLTDLSAQRKLGKAFFAYEHIDDKDDPVTAVIGAMVKESIRCTHNNKNELVWSNGSKMHAGTSHRGGTSQILHVSELGPIAYQFPDKAEQIRAGSLNTIHPGSRIFIESTHEGGRSGTFYDFIELAMKTPNPQTKLDWQFHFFAWHQDKDNAIEPPPGWEPSGELQNYFDSLDIPLTAAQRFWYSRKLDTQKDSMKKEHPSTVEEAINSVIRGAIYAPIIAQLYRAGRVLDFAHDRRYPCFTSWDIGQTDYTCIWLLQFQGMDWAVLDYYTSKGQPASHYAEQIVLWERDYGPIRQHYLPHDADNRVGPVPRTWRMELSKSGLNNIKVVPRTGDKWVGINQLRELLPRFYFRQKQCNQEWVVGGEKLTSGLACLEGYHTAPSTDGVSSKDEPVHDHTSHGCDALRTFAEAYGRGMLNGVTGQNMRTRTLDGEEGWDDHQGVVVITGRKGERYPPGFKINNQAVY